MLRITAIFILLLIIDSFWKICVYPSSVHSTKALKKKRMILRIFAFAFIIFEVNSRIKSDSVFSEKNKFRTFFEFESVSVSDLCLKVLRYSLFFKSALSVSERIVLSVHPKLWKKPFIFEFRVLSIRFPNISFQNYHYPFYRILCFVVEYFGRLQEYSTWVKTILRLSKPRVISLVLLSS